MAGFNLGDILVNIKANTDGAKQGLNDIQNLGDKTQQMGMSVQKGLNVAAAGLGVVGAGLTVFAKSATNYTEDLVKSSKSLGQQIGVSTSDASRLVAAFGRMGIGAQDAAQMFGIFSKQIVAATQNSEATSLAYQKLEIQISQTKESIAVTNAAIAKNGDASGQLGLKIRQLNNDLASQQNALDTSANTFQKLGISTLDATGKQKDFQTLLGEVADKFKAMPDGVNKTADAMSLFGRSGKDMIKVLDLGSAGISDLEKQADKLGLTLNANTITSINDLITAQKDLKEQTDAMKISVGTATAPVLASFDRMLNRVTAALIGAHSPVKGLTTDILAFGGPVASGAAGVLAFAANLDQSLPILKGFVGVLGNPYVLAALAAAAAIGGLIYVGEKYLSHNHDLAKAFDDQQDKLTGLNAKYASTVSLLQIFQDRQTEAENGVTNAIAAHKAALDAIAPSQEVAKQKADAVSTAQVAVKAALDQFGANSPQYKAATDVLAQANYLYNQQLLTNWGLEVNIKTSSDNLAAARSNLAATTADLNRVQGILNNGLDSGISIIAKFGPTASAQLGAIATLQNSLSIVVATFNGFSANIQAGVPKINQQLGGISNALQIYQGQSDRLNASLSQAASFNPQNASITIQGKRAAGGPVNPGGPYLVGEQGSELFVPQSSGQIIPHDMTNNLLSDLMNVGDMLKQFLSQGAGAFLSSPHWNPAMAGSAASMTSTTNIGTINIQDRADADYLLSQLDRNFQLQHMGLSPAS